MQKKTRISLDLDVLQFETLKRITEMTYSSSKVSVLRRALMLYGVMVMHLKDGYTISLEKGKEKKHINIFMQPEQQDELSKHS